MCLVLEGEDARRFREYEKDPTNTPEGLILWYEAHLIPLTLDGITIPPVMTGDGADWVRKRIEYLKPLCEENKVRKSSEFKKMFEEAGL